MENLQVDKLVVRTDPLTGSKNLIAFAETINALCSLPVRPPFSLVTMDVNAMEALNRLQGQVKGDTVLRWMALLAQDGFGAQFFRIGGDEFVALLEKTASENVECARNVFDRLNNQAAGLALQAPIASMSVIHFSGEEALAPVDVFILIYGAIVQVKKQFNRSFQVFQYPEIDSEADPRMLARVANHMIERVIYLGARLDESLEMAFTDPVTGLPNLRLAQRRLEQAIAAEGPASRPFALLLIDGDDLRRYNDISYAEGDRMIYNLGQVFRQALRPEDFLARWKVGDEFLVLLDGADAFGAMRAGERICLAVQQASQTWKLPVTVSVGVALFPHHATSADALVQAAETANSLSKQRGKNRATLFA